MLYTFRLFLRQTVRKTIHQNSFFNMKTSMFRKSCKIRLMGKSISPSFQTAGSSVKSSTQKLHVHCKRGNVEINNSPQANELKRFPTNAVLVVVLINPKPSHSSRPPLRIFTRGNVEITNSPQAGIEAGGSRFKIQHSTE